MQWPLGLPASVNISAESSEPFEPVLSPSAVPGSLVRSAILPSGSPGTLTRGSPWLRGPATLSVSLLHRSDAPSPRAAAGGDLCWLDVSPSTDIIVTSACSAGPHREWPAARRSLSRFLPIRLDEPSVEGRTTFTSVSAQPPQ